MIEDVKITIKKSTPIKSNYKKSTPLSNINETIIRKAELNTLTLGDDLSRIYDKFGLSSKKRKRDIDTCGCDPSVFIVWKKNITGFSSRIAITTNKNFLNKPI